MYDTICKSNTEFCMKSERDKFIFVMNSKETKFCVSLSQVYLYVC